MVTRICIALQLTALAVAAPLQAQVDFGANGKVDIERDLARIREATRPFHDLSAARAAGYPTNVSTQCVESAAGVMGHHIIHPDLLDDQLDVERPEILVYAPTDDGELELAGVEYVVPYSAWQRDEAPRILGQDLRRSDDLGIWYLHVWVWRENPSGLFADWNPTLTCSPTAPQHASQRIRRGRS